MVVQPQAAQLHYIARELIILDLEGLQLDIKEVFHYMGFAILQNIQQLSI